MKGIDKLSGKKVIWRLGDQQRPVQRPVPNAKAPSNKPGGFFDPNCYKAGTVSDPKASNEEYNLKGKGAPVRLERDSDNQKSTQGLKRPSLEQAPSSSLYNALTAHLGSSSAELSQGSSSVGLEGSSSAELSQGSSSVGLEGSQGHLVQGFLKVNLH